MKARRKGRPRWILPALIVASLGITAFALLRPRAPQATPVNVVQARTGTLLKTVNGTGAAKAEVSRSLSFSGAGNVETVLVKVGDEVKAGQELARLQTTSTERELAAARASLQSAEADLARAQATASDSQLDLKRQLDSAQNAVRAAQAGYDQTQRSLSDQQQLYRVGATSAQNLRNAQDAFAEAGRKLETARSDLNYARSKGTQAGQAGVAQARSALEAARVRVQNLQQTLADATLRAPTGGTVSAVNVTAGNPAPAAQSAIEITDPAQLYLEVPFDETRAAALRPGQPAEVQFDALPNQTISGTVSRVDPVARSSGQVASVNARIRLQDVRDLKPGFTATATVTTRRVRDAVIVPLETTSDDGQGQIKVWVVTPANAASGTGATVNPQTVTVIERTASEAAVSGVKAGDLLVTPAPAPDTLKKGQAVTYAAPTPAGTKTQGNTPEGKTSP